MQLSSLTIVNNEAFEHFSQYFHQQWCVSPREMGAGGGGVKNNPGIFIFTFNNYIMP